MTDTSNMINNIPPHAFVPLPPDHRRNWCSVCGKPREYYIHNQNVPAVAPPENIADEALRIVYGDREKAYDDPNQNFRRIALMWTGTLDKKLRDGQCITPRDVALMFVQLKISREAFHPQHDNRVDMIGYTLCLQRIAEGEEEDNSAE